MLWLYVILGLAAFASAAEGLLRGARTDPEGRPAATFAHSVAVILVAVAWFAQHLRPAGWAAMLGGVLIEAWVRVELRRRAPRGEAGHPPAATISLGEVTVLSGEAFSPADAPPVAPAAPPRPDLVVRCIALLASPSNVGPEVLLAALRRSGERDAALESGADVGRSLRIGSLRLELRPDSQPLALRLLRAAAAQSWDWPEAGRVAEAHAAQMEFSLRAHSDTPPAEIVRRHLQAAAALGEFARVLALCWPEAPRLMRPPQAAAPGDVEVDATRSCVAFRDARRAGPAPGSECHLCDSVGLHAFGLPDVEIETPGPPPPETTRRLYELVARIFRGGANVDVAALLTSAQSTTWQLRPGRATVPPDREVLQLIARQPEPPS